MESENKRLHGLDSYRAILMILGVVIHTALLYHLSKVIGAIHTFRMPAFFLLSGYFGALLFYKRDFIKMIKNRVKRVVFPFFVFVFLFFPINTFLWTYLDSFNKGVIDPFEYSLNFTIKEKFLPTDTMHFWFLYDLIFVIFIVITINLWMEKLSYSFPNLQNKLKRVLEGKWSFFVFVGGINFFWCITFTWGGIPTSTSWVPNILIIFYYTFFYSIGWLLYTLKIDLRSFSKNAWVILLFGLLCSLLFNSFDHLFNNYDDKIGFIDQWDKVLWFFLKIFLSSLSLVFWIRGLLGIFLKYCSTESKIWRYISDSSYWVFIVHISFCPPMFILLSGWSAPYLLRYLISAILVFFLCLITYDGFVRSTFIGRFLNGRTYPSFKKRLSLILCLLIGGGLSFLYLNPPGVLERPSPWVKGKTPPELLPKINVTYPNVKKEAIFKGVSLGRCAKVKNYMICPDGVQYEDAKKSCEVLEGKLASFENKKQYEEVMEWLPKILKRRIWLPITDSKEEGTWVGLDKRPLDFNFWMANEPNDYGKGEDCAEIRLWRKTPNWNDISCDSKLAFMCELKKDSH